MVDTPDGATYTGSVPRQLVWASILAVVAGVPLVSQSPQPAQLSAPDAITLRIIVADSADHAKRIIERLSRGENFVAIAMAESIDPSALAGGLLGKVEPSSLRAEVREAVQDLRPGEVTPVVRIPTGFAVLKLVEDAGHDNAKPLDPSRIPALAATGSIKYRTQIGGFSEAEIVLRGFSKPADWDQDPETICRMSRESRASAHAALESYFSAENDAARAAQPPFDVAQGFFARAQLYGYEGRMDRAVEEYRKAYEFALAKAAASAPGSQLALAIAHLHKAEMDNDVYHAPGEMCLLPIRPGLSFALTEDLEKAIEHLRAYLRQHPDELDVRWLLNLAYMNLGTHPDEVPPEQLIPATVFASEGDVGRFRDVAPAAGLDVFATAAGVIVDDFTGTGRLDVVVSNMDTCGPLRYLGNNGDGTFTQRTSAAGLDAQLGGLNIVQSDYNNDGCKDILVMRGGWQIAQRRSLLRNNCDGTFTDVTAESGLAKPATSSQTAAWADIDNDGLLDLFVGNEQSPTQLFLNKGNGTFEDIARAAGVDRVAFSKGVAAADYDNDGFVDLYVSNIGSDNFLYRNNRDRTFTEMAQAAGAPGPGRGFATWFFDYDNDGWQDLFVTSYFLSLDESVRTYVGAPRNAVPLHLYKNLRDGSFREVSAEVGLDRVFLPMGANFGDIDNDGFLDIYMGTGDPSYASLIPSVLLRNREGKSFVDVTASAGMGELHKGHGIAFADLDNDGDQDVVAEFGGATPGDSHTMRVFENPGHGNDWISLKLVGVKTNRAAIGARIAVTVEDEAGRTRSIHRTVGSGGSFGASPLEQHIGLGKSARTVDLEIWWPTSNTRQRFPGVGKNQVLEITESAPAPRRVERPVVRLGGARRAP
jgi:tetratricopeptide (TPR) repeat protein